jgi:hypothetical protein
MYAVLCLCRICYQLCWVSNLHYNQQTARMIPMHVKPLQCKILRLLASGTANVYSAYII